MTKVPKMALKKNEYYVCLTFDDRVTRKEKKILRFLEEKRISATFFVPFASLDEALIQELRAGNHELGWHGYNHTHSDMEDSYAKALELSKDLILQEKVISVRLPYLKRKETFYHNLRRYGLKVDSSFGSHHFPSKTYNQLHKKYGLFELPIFELPTKHKMDIDIGNYDELMSCVLSGLRKGEVLVIGFHGCEQIKHWKKFKELINKLIREKVCFLTIGNAFNLMNETPDQK